MGFSPSWLGSRKSKGTATKSSLSRCVKSTSTAAVASNPVPWYRKAPELGLFSKASRECGTLSFFKDILEELIIYAYVSDRTHRQSYRACDRAPWRAEKDDFRRAVYRAPVCCGIPPRAFHRR